MTTQATQQGTYQSAGYILPGKAGIGGRAIGGARLAALVACVASANLADGNADVLPVEPQRVIGHVSATAAVVAPENAQATVAAQNRLHVELGSGRGVLPFLTEADAPKLAFAVPNTTPQDAQNNTATQEGL